MHVLFLHYIGSRQKVQVRAAYNISEEYLTRETFLEILPLCPTLVDIFDKQLSQRLVDCYGRDIRLYSELEQQEDHTKDETKKDFSWILQQKSTKP